MKTPAEGEKSKSNNYLQNQLTSVEKSLHWPYISFELTWNYF